MSTTSVLTIAKYVSMTLYFILLFGTTRIRAGEDVSSSNSSSSGDVIQVAIERSRQHLQQHMDSPLAFPNTRYRLALMLESQENNNNSLEECIQLYRDAAKNQTAASPKRRVLSLHRAANLLIEQESIYENQTTGSSRSLLARELLYQALSIQDQELQGDQDRVELSFHYASVFETLVQLLLTSVEQEEEEKNLKEALDLCKKCLTLCPKEPVVNEYMGAVLRRMYNTRANLNNLNLGKLDPTINSAAAALEVYQCYQTAAAKSHRAVVNSIFGVDHDAIEQENYPYGQLPPITSLKHDDGKVEKALWNRLVRHIILAACSAREAQLSTSVQDEHFNYGLVLLEYWDDKQQVFDPEVAADLLNNVGIAYKRRDQLDVAAQYFERALQVHPEDGHALVQLASLERLDNDDKQGTTIVKLQDSYVAGLFDGYSQRFEQELVQDLQYTGHVLVADALFSDKARQDWLHSKEGVTTTIVDLGCGTGLLGELVRDRISRYKMSDTSCTNNEELIYGVDLSQRMASISRSRQIDKVPVYSQVSVSDGTAFLQSLPNDSVDAITASDVFIYVGALEEVFVECARTLRGGGLLCFTVELLPPVHKDTSLGVKLLKSGRFGHSRQYVTALAEKNGLELEEWKNEVLRKQGTENVQGSVVTIRKPL